MSASDSLNATEAAVNSAEMPVSNNLKSFLNKLTKVTVPSTTAKISHPSSIISPQELNSQSSQSHSVYQNSNLKSCDIVDLVDDDVNGAADDNNTYPNVSKALFTTAHKGISSSIIPIHNNSQSLSSSSSSSSISPALLVTNNIQQQQMNNNSTFKATSAKVVKSTKPIKVKPVKVTAVKKVPAKNLPHALLWICHNGLGQKKSWTGNTLKVMGVYPTKEAAEHKKEEIMSRHECYGHGDICVGDSWEDEIDLVVKPIDDVAL